ncbi:MAG TPA: alpha/beta family hydrolase [Actinomycetota bacterium]
MSPARQDVEAGAAETTIAVGGRTVSGLVVHATSAVALCAIAHGAGNDMRHPFFQGIAQGLAGGGVSSLRFNFPYMEEGRRAPDRPALLMETWRAALGEAARQAKRRPLVASGKSLGGRMASLVAAEDGDAFAARALVFFGYPLHAPGKPDQARDQQLPSITVPMLFLQGTADPLARFDLMRALTERLGSRATLRPVEGGDHSFRVRGAKRPDDEIGRDLGATAADWIAQAVG